MGVRFDVLKFRGCQASTAPVLTQALPIRKLHNKCREGSDERGRQKRVNLEPQSLWVSDLML
jgi:hypothetical protein